MIFNRLSSKDVIKHFERSKEEGKERDCIDIRSNEKDLVRTREASTRDSKEAHMLLQQLVDHQVNIYSNTSTGQKRGGRDCVDIRSYEQALVGTREASTRDSRFSPIQPL